MVIGGRDRAERSLKWKGKLTGKIESEMKEGKTEAKCERRGLISREKARANFEHLKG
jgi:hypothetical protein